MWLKIIPEEPLVLGSVRPDAQFLATRTHIPGRLLRGAWAEWLKMQGVGDILGRVQRLHIGNFFPAVDEGELQYVLPFPLTAMTCKHHPGFRSEFLEKHQGHGVVDTLLPQLAYHLLERAGARMTVPFTLTCAQCDTNGRPGRMEQIDGFYGLYRYQKKEGYVRFRPRFHAQTKVALSRFRRASHFRMLYTVNALAPRAPAIMSKNGSKPVVFLGRVYGDPQAVQELQQALDHVAIGALHTRGYGRAKAEIADIPGWPGLKERIKDFNRLLATLWQDLKRLAVNLNELPEKPEGLYFSVDLLSPGVFVNNGLPELVPELHIDGKALRPIWWATRPDMASGWSTAWGLPKPTNLAARTGSVYVYRWDGSLDDLLPTLQALEAEGLGLRRDEGFGEAVVCHPFHQEVEER
ncbi:MAG: CRISPR-associated RAMP protein Csx10 [Thermoproteota archaeon]|nr:MAG: CRISPR-associated RAMP protein Csx10 [Candidatus Korarchaeota archaeon]